MRLVLLLLFLVGSVSAIAGLPAPAIGADDEPVVAPLDGRTVVSGQLGDTFYQADPAEGFWADVGKLFRTKIAPSLGGAVLLLGLSVLFSTINFYSALCANDGETPSSPEITVEGRREVSQSWRPPRRRKPCGGRARPVPRRASMLRALRW